MAHDDSRKREAEARGEQAQAGMSPRLNEVKRKPLVTSLGRVPRPNADAKAIEWLPRDVGPARIRANAAASENEDYELCTFGARWWIRRHMYDGPVEIECVETARMDEADARKLWADLRTGRAR